MTPTLITKTARHGLALTLAVGLGVPAQAIELYSDDDAHLNADVLAVYGLFNSRKNYDGTTGGSTWREGFVKYGLGGDYRLRDAGTAYGAFALVSSGTWGDGDPGGNSTGAERTTKIEDAYLGWRSGELFPVLGKDGVDVSAGRQQVRLGRGFLINDDGANLGQGPADGALNRGGAYYLAARHAFDRTAVIRLGGTDGLHGSAVWLKSDNRAQANTEMAAGTLDYTHALGTLGVTYIHGLDVDDRWASDFQRQRDGMNVYSLRGEGSLGVPDTTFAFEYARQHPRSGSERTAWYGEAAYSFSSAPWTPSVSYRYSRYSKDWDLLFTGQSTGYGTWFQGEVAANYSGPFATNAAIHHVGLKANPLPNVTLGALYYDINSVSTASALDLSARELDLYVEWAVNEHLIVTPLVGLYKPDRDAQSGGNQVNGNGTNVYTQLVVAVPF
ncbi:hypothetical protein SJI00_08565 [Pseudomonas sp. RP23018S]|uniref:hypothetical protein n=1 Tax=Pseudomonas sp. RP23018S TaxID=3096037 RepID=UPI002AC9FF26|nr:hypothetical protein [Pseudomonas sp. RP23018S]MDZ5602825.1 hypothetical protein [Pseudomonas sp. RP23018S]